MSQRRDADVSSPKPVRPKAYLNLDVQSRSSGSGEAPDDSRVSEELRSADGPPESLRPGGLQQESGDVEEMVPDEDDIPERNSREKAKQKPKGPSSEELRIHRATHCPYRSWCPKCVAGRGRQGSHNQGEEGQDETPVVCMDYCFLRRGEEGEQSVPVLVGRVKHKNVLIAHVARCATLFRDSHYGLL